MVIIDITLIMRNSKVIPKNNAVLRSVNIQVKRLKNSHIFLGYYFKIMNNKVLVDIKKY